MSSFTKKQIDKYASDLLIGLSESERDMIKEEFEEIERNMDLINKIPNIKNVEILSYPYEMTIETLRSDESKCEQIEIDDLLSNCDKVDGREVEVPKVVG